MLSKPYLQSIRFQPQAQIDFDEYPFAIPAMCELEQLSFHPNVTLLVSENGSGKSTILESIALAMGYSSEGVVLTPISKPLNRPLPCMSPSA